MRHRALLLFICALGFGLAAVVMTYQSLSLRPAPAPVVAEALPPPPPPPRATMSSMIGDEHRAITIRVNDVIGVGGFVLPGDRVDVLLTRSASNEVPATDVLLQNVKVLGVDQEASDLKEAARALGRPIAHTILRADQIFVTAANEGLPLAEVKGGRRVAKKVAQLIQAIVATAKV